MVQSASNFCGTPSEIFDLPHVGRSESIFCFPYWLQSITVEFLINQLMSRLVTISWPTYSTKYTKLRVFAKYFSLVIQP
jgi:hypothetical protein